jgi:hypothetical protein
VPAKKRSHALRRVALLAGLVTALVVGYIAFPFLAAAVALEGTRVAFTRSGEAAWYEVSFGKLVPAGIEGFEDARVEVLEAVPFGASGEHAVLARAEGTPGIALGILRADGSFAPVVADGTLKADLAVNSAGVAAYTETPDIFSPTEEEAEGLVQEAAPDTNPDGYDPAVFLAPIDIPAGEEEPPLPMSPFSGTLSRIATVSLAGSNTVPAYHGEGRMPRALADGSFVALAREGLIRIAASGERSLVLPRTDADKGAISKDGKEALLPGPGGFERFTLESADASGIRSLGSAGYAQGDIALLDDTHAFALSGSHASFLRLDRAKERAVVLKVSANQ